MARPDTLKQNVKIITYALTQNDKRHCGQYEHHAYGLVEGEGLTENKHADAHGCNRFKRTKN